MSDHGIRGIERQYKNIEYAIIDYYAFQKPWFMAVLKPFMIIFAMVVEPVHLVVCLGFLVLRNSDFLAYFEARKEGNE